MPYTRDLSQRNLHLLYGIGSVLRMDFQENASNGRPGTADKALRSSYREPFIFDRLQPSLTSMWDMHGECKCWSSRKSSRMEAEIQPRRDFVKQVKWPLLLTHWNQPNVHFSSSRVPLVTKVTYFVANVRGLLDMNFRENAFNRRRDISLLKCPQLLPDRKKLVAKAGLLAPVARNQNGRP